MKNTATFKDLIEALLEGATEGVSATGTLKIKGDQLVYYNTPIAERCGEQVIVNVSRYSLATGQLQKQIRSIVPEEKQVVVKKVSVDYAGSLKDFIDIVK